MCILIRVYQDPTLDAPLDPADLIVCDPNGTIIYFNTSAHADAFREEHGISSQIYEL